jgi:RimJ/RimL family protein N-acetyltransferase
MATERQPPSFILRPPRAEDAMIYCGFLADPQVHVWLEDRCQRPITLPHAQAYVLAEAWYRCAIECDGTFVGMAGLEDVDGSRGVARFFIVIGDRRYWGRGLGQAVTCAILEKGFTDLGLRKVHSDYLAPNEGSRIIHERVGFKVDGVARQDRWRRGQWVDRVFLSILKDEFQGRQ